MNYEEMYPSPRLATPEEIEGHKLYKISEAEKLKNTLEWNLEHVDIYGYVKEGGSELSITAKRYVRNGHENDEMKGSKYSHTKYLAEMLEKIRETEIKFDVDILDADKRSEILRRVEEIEESRHCVIYHIAEDKE